MSFLNLHSRTQFLWEPWIRNNYDTLPEILAIGAEINPFYDNFLRWLNFPQNQKLLKLSKLSSFNVIYGEEKTERIRRIYREYIINTTTPSRNTKRKKYQVVYICNLSCMLFHGLWQWWLCESNSKFTVVYYIHNSPKLLWWKLFFML